MISYLSRISRLTILKPETQPDAARRPRCSKTVLVILLIEDILDRCVQPQGHFFFLKSKSISGRQIAFAVAVETKNVGRKRRVAEYRREINARRKKIEIYPKPFKPLRRDQRKLMIRNAKCFADATARDLRRSLIAVGKCV